MSGIRFSDLSLISIPSTLGPQRYNRTVGLYCMKGDNVQQTIARSMQITPRGDHHTTELLDGWIDSIDCFEIFSGVVPSRSMLPSLFMLPSLSMLP